MELFELEEKQHVSREAAAKLLVEIADSLARHNSLDVKRGGLKFNIAVADEVDVELEIEIDDEGSKIEIEISW